MATTRFTEAERGAMQERNKELKAGKGNTKPEVLEKLAAMPAADRELGERLHELIRTSVPELTAKTWYGMPAYYRNGKMICFFQSAAKFKARYATLGFSDNAHLDDGAMWPAYYALTELTPDTEARIAALLKQALS